MTYSSLALAFVPLVVSLAASGGDAVRPAAWARHAASVPETLTRTEPIAPDVSDLELSEVPAVTTGSHDTMVVFLTGDGGWADLDQAIAHRLAASGVSTVGWSSLGYYWTPRTPETAAADLTRIIRHYRFVWGVSHVSLVGYSFGADVLPFLVNRLPSDVAARVSAITLLGLSDTATFEFHVANWVGVAGPGYPTEPELHRMSVPVTCVYGAGDDETICPKVRVPGVQIVRVGRLHHFSHDYAGLVAAILNQHGRT